MTHHDSIEAGWDVMQPGDTITLNGYPFEVARSPVWETLGPETQMAFVVKSCDEYGQCEHMSIRRDGTVWHAWRWMSKKDRDRWLT